MASNRPPLSPKPAMPTNTSASKTFLIVLATPLPYDYTYAQGKWRRPMNKASGADLRLAEQERKELRLQLVSALARI